jgi:hypothetical protein
MSAQTVGGVKWNKVVGQEYTVSKWWISEDLAKIEEYLNQMIAQGFRPVRIGWTNQFTFVPCEPGEYICRTVMTMTNGGFYDKTKAAELSDLLVADGAYLVEQYATMGYRVGLIAVRPAAAGPFELTTDLDSRIAEYCLRKKYYEGQFVVWLSLGAMWSAIGSMQGMTFAHVSHISYISHISAILFFISALYYAFPVTRDQKAIKRLKAHRDVSEV